MPAAVTASGSSRPYISYAEASVKSSTYEPGVIVPAGSPLAFTAAYLNAKLNSILKNAPVQKTASIGVRWDFAKNVALKLQYDRTRIGEGSHGTLDNMQPDYVPGGKFSVFSMTLDCVF